LSFLRKRSGKSARLKGQDFDREGVNSVVDEKAEAEEARLKELAKLEAEAKAAEQAAVEAELAAKAAEVEARHTQN